jgi:hypothetical protein
MPMEFTMANTSFAVGLLALATLAAPGAAPAASFPPVPAVDADHAGLVQTVQWGHCRYWRHECARRWGWGGWEYRRCRRRGARNHCCHQE